MSSVSSKKATKLVVAFMGNFCFEKGSHVFESIVKGCAQKHLPIEWWIIGGIGDLRTFQSLLKVAQVRTVGYYHNDELDKLLNEHNIMIGLLLSVFPESYSKLGRLCIKLKLPVIINKVGIFAQWPKNEWIVPNLDLYPEKVIAMLESAVKNRSIMQSVQQHQYQFFIDQHLNSKNQKHVLYNQLMDLSPISR